MTHDPEKYKGIEINVEFINGEFVPSIHDSLKHQEHGFARIPTCAAGSYQTAVAKAHAWIDKSCASEVEEFAKKSKLKFA